MAENAAGARGMLVPEAQRRLGGLSDDAVYGLIASGALRAVKAGRRWVIPEQALSAYLDGRTDR